MTLSQFEQFIRAEQAYLREPVHEPEDYYERDEDFEREEREEFTLWENA